MMDVIELAASALEPINEEGIPVIQGWYEESLKKTHVTLWKLRDYEAGHSDDGCEVEAATLQVNIWSDRDRQDLVKRIKKLMKAAGFTYTEGNDDKEPDTGIFNNGMRFVMVQEAEEDKED